MLNKYEMNELKARALSEVADTVTSSLRWAEDAVNDSRNSWEAEPDSTYYEAQTYRAEQVLAIWNEILALLDKKLSK